MRTPISNLTGREFDVAVIGAGVNGASAAQHLAAAGYSVILVDQGDFGSGSSSRSSRLLHCGLRFLDRGESIWNIVKRPDRFLVACARAKRAMRARSQMVRTAPERLEAFTFFVPLYRGDPYSGWQVDAAFRILQGLGINETPLDYKRLVVEEARAHPLLGLLRDYDRLRSVFSFREYRFEWPERIAIDTVLDAERMGAVVRNYCKVVALDRTSDGRWELTLRDATEGTAQATVHASLVLNTTGIWIDRVNKLARDNVSRKILGTKGVHIMVKLPPECSSYGVTTFHRQKFPFYCIPQQGLHYFGPTETPFEGDIDDIHPTDDEIDWLVAEADYLLPGANIKRSDVLFAWAGVRPLTHSPSRREGKQHLIPVIHDLASDGLPGVLALTGGALMIHRLTGADLCKAVQARIGPSRTPQPLSYAARAFPDNQNSPRLLDHNSSIKLSDLHHAAEQEHPVTLVDLLFRRTSAGWTETMGGEAAGKAAETVADTMGWDAERVGQEVANYQAFLEKAHRIDIGASGRRGWT